MANATRKDHAQILYWNTKVAVELKQQRLRLIDMLQTLRVIHKFFDDEDSPEIKKIKCCARHIFTYCACVEECNQMGNLRQLRRLEASKLLREMTKTSVVLCQHTKQCIRDYVNTYDTKGNYYLLLPYNKIESNERENDWEEEAGKSVFEELSSDTPFPSPRRKRCAQDDSVLNLRSSSGAAANRVRAIERFDQFRETEKSMQYSLVRKASRTSLHRADDYWNDTATESSSRWSMEEEYVSTSKTALVSSSTAMRSRSTYSQRLNEFSEYDLRNLLLKIAIGRNVREVGYCMGVAWSAARCAYSVAHYKFPLQGMKQLAFKSLNKKPPQLAKPANRI